MQFQKEMTPEVVPVHSGDGLTTGDGLGLGSVAAVDGLDVVVGAVPMLSFDAAAPGSLNVAC